MNPKSSRGIVDPSKERIWPMRISAMVVVEKTAVAMTRRERMNPSEGLESEPIVGERTLAFLDSINDL